MAKSFKTMEALKREVEKQGVLTIPMTELRTAYGAQRLGRNIRDDIAASLADLDLGHYPQTLPSNQHDVIRIYAVGSPAQAVIEAVMAPGPEGDQALMQFLQSSVKKTRSRKTTTNGSRAQKQKVAEAEPQQEENKELVSA